MSVVYSLSCVNVPVVNSRFLSPSLLPLSLSLSLLCITHSLDLFLSPVLFLPPVFLRSGEGEGAGGAMSESERAV